MIRRIAREEAEHVVAATRADVGEEVRRAARREAGRAVSAVLASSATAEAIRAGAADVAAHVATAAVDLRLSPGSIVPVLAPEIAELAGRTARREAERIIRAATPALVEVSVNDSGLTHVDGDTHRILPDLLLVVGAGCHAFLVGPAGTGKSTLAKQAAQALGLDFFALSVGPTTPTSKMFGYQDARGNYHRTPLRDAYEHGGLMLLDELDNGHPGLLTELNQALSLDVCAFPDGMVTRHERFRLVATGNTFGLGGDRQYVGRQALDAATLDRLVTLQVEIDEQLETRLALAQAPSVQEKARLVLADVRRLRRTAEAKRLPLVFSPRASIHAARLLQGGATRDQALRWCVTTGLSEAHRAALGLPTP